MISEGKKGITEVFQSSILEVFIRDRETVRKNGKRRDGERGEFYLV